jgi:Bacterial mobilisation protein (MobC)
VSAFATTGRPKKAAAEQRSESLPAVRVTAAERAFVEEMAADAGLPLTEFCRQAVLRRRITPRPTDPAASALVELNRVGVNLNQIAHRLNASGKAPRSLVDTLAEVRRVVALLADGLE